MVVSIFVILFPDSLLGSLDCSGLSFCVICDLELGFPIASYKLSPIMKGLLVSDSLMKHLKSEYLENLQTEYKLDLVELVCKPGFTTEQLIGQNGVAHDLLKKNDYTHLFLCCGANDFNKCPQQTSDRKAHFVVGSVQGYLHSFSETWPDIKVKMFPIPFRQVCREDRRNAKYPNNYNIDWIKTTNAAIQSYQDNFQPCRCHQAQISWVRSPGLPSWYHHLSPDGLHLTPDGKGYMIELVCRSNAPVEFNCSQSSFPALPSKQDSGFSFEPQVSIPKIVRVPRKKPQIISVQSLYFGPNPAAPIDIDPPMLPHAKSVVITSPSSRKRSKKSKSEWLYTSVIDPDTVFSQVDRNQKRLRVFRKWTMPGNGSKAKNRRRAQRQKEKKQLQRASLPVFKSRVDESDFESDKKSHLNHESTVEYDLKHLSSTSCELKNEHETFSVQDFGLFGHSNNSSHSFPPSSPTKSSSLQEVPPSFSSQQPLKDNGSRNPAPGGKVKFKTNRYLSEWRRKGKHQECSACSFVERCEGEEISSFVKFLLRERKVLRLYLDFLFEGEILAQKTYYIAKCTSIEYLTSFLTHEFGFLSVWVLHDGRILHPNSCIFENGLNMNDVVEVMIGTIGGGGGKSNWYCKLCDGYFSSKDVLDDHVSSVHSSQKETGTQKLLPGYFDDQSKKDREHKAGLFICQLCDKGFASQTALDMHHQRSHGNFICVPCKKGFKTKAHFTRHNNKEHSNESVFKEEDKKTSDPTPSLDLWCESCQKGFKSVAGLKRHIASHTKKTGIAEKTDTVKKTWKENSKAVKSGVINKVDEVLSPMFQCPNCPKQFRLKHSLTNHLKSHVSKKEKIVEHRQKMKDKMAQKRADPVQRH